MDVICIDSVDIDSIECIACFDLCIDSVDIPFNVHTTNKVTMITVSGFLTI